MYSYFLSSASLRMRIALNLKNIDYEIVPINLRENEHRSEEYLKLNPQGMVPTLVLDEKVFYESLPIAEYLEETRPGKIDYSSQIDGFKHEKKEERASSHVF